MSSTTRSCATQAGLEGHATRGYLGTWHDTERLHRYMLAATPEAFPVRYNLVLFLERQGRTDEALAEYQRVPAQRPDHWRARLALGSLYMRSSQPAEAIPHLTAALALDPNHVRAREQLEATLRWLGQPAEQKKAGPANAPGSTP